MRRDVRYPPADDEVIEDEDPLPDNPIDINAPIPEEEQAFAFYYPNVSFINMRALIEKELGL